MSTEGTPANVLAPTQHEAAQQMLGLAASERLFLNHHEVVLRDLLGPDYDFAQQSGLTDIFYLNPVTGQDGILHTLAGDIMTGEDGSFAPGGFHHEPSSRDKYTFVDRDHLEGRSKKSAREFKELPYHPYAANVVLEGFRKTKRTVNGETGESKVFPAKNGMYPKEYDALAVMQTIAQAVNNRDTQHDYLSGSMLITEGNATMLDGESQMRLKICLDAETGKVVSAYPIVTIRAKKPFEREEITKHLGI